MKIMVVGGGGREHAIIKKLKENKQVEEIFALPGNGGIAADATCVDIGAKDIDRIVEFAVDNKVDFAVVAPDDPLVLGAVDALQARGIKTFGPNKKAAKRKISWISLLLSGGRSFSSRIGQICPSIFSLTGPPATKNRSDAPS